MNFPLTFPLFATRILEAEAGSETLDLSILIFYCFYLSVLGGCNLMLGLIAMAQDAESLYASVKALVGVLKSNPFSRGEMEESGGYKTMAMLLRKKSAFINSNILHLVFSLAGTVDSGKEMSNAPNLCAFHDLLCDLELWNEAAADVEKALYEHFLELLSKKKEQGFTYYSKILKENNLVEKLLVVLKKSEGSSSTTITLMNVLHAVLCNSPSDKDLVCFAQFTAVTIQTDLENENDIDLDSEFDGINVENKNCLSIDTKKVIVRNRCLQLFLSLLFIEGDINQKLCVEIISVLGFDWILLYLQRSIHSTSIILALKILSTLLSIPDLLNRFREGSCNGGWVMKSEMILQNKMGAALGQSSKSSRVNQMKIQQDVFIIPGFQLLSWLMPFHISISEVYYLLLSIVFGQPAQILPSKDTFDLDTIWNYVFNESIAKESRNLDPKITLCGEAMITLLTMVRSLLNEDFRNSDFLTDKMKVNTT